MEKLKTTAAMLHLKIVEADFREKKSRQPKKFH